TAGHRTPLCVHDVPTATRPYDGRRAHQGGGAAGLRDPWAGTGTGVGCAALGAAAWQGASTCARTLRPGPRTARHGAPDLSPGDGPSRGAQTLVLPRRPA